MLYLIGLGLKPTHLTLEAKAAIAKCQKAFLENYTSLYSAGSKTDLEKLIQKKVVELLRKNVEEELDSVLSLAKKQTVVLLVFGNPLTATTHIQILLDAYARKIKVEIVPGISITNELGQTGLDVYKFGRIASIPFWQKGFEPESFFDIIQKNHENGLHSLCLLDIQHEKNRFMTVSYGIEILQKIAEKRKSTLIENAVLLGLYAMGSSKQKIRVGTAKELLKKKETVFPQCLVVCGRVNQKEKEALQTLYGFKSFSKKEKTQTKNELETKVEKYFDLTQAALKKIRIKPDLTEQEKIIATDFVHMAQNYFSDAQHFWKIGDLATALAAFSYAHAWLDAGVRAGVLDGQNDDQLFTLP